MNRWKCPDCGGWVAESVPVHKCSVGTATETNTGFKCNRCGAWYVGSHYCAWVSYAPTTTWQTVNT